MKNRKNTAIYTPKFRIYVYWILLGVILCHVTIIRLRLLDFPLERDEGEFAYFGQLILDGIPPYSIAYNMKLPGTYYVYAFIMFLFGETTAGIHFGLMIVNLFTICLLFLLVRKMLDSYAGIIASASYAILSLSPSVMGFAAHAMHFIVLFALAGIYLILKTSDIKKKSSILVSGLFFGMAFLMKQAGMFFFFLAFLYINLVFLSLANRSFKKTLLLNLFFVGGFLVPYIFVAVYLFFTGIFDTFWFWTFHYAREYATTASITAGLEMFKKEFPRVVSHNYLLWFTAAIGLVSLWFYRINRRVKLLIALLTLFSLIAVCPSFRFSPHYFILILPAVSILTGVTFSYIPFLLATKFNASRLSVVPLLAFLGMIFFIVYKHKDYYYTQPVEQLSQSIYGFTPFLQSIQIAKYVKANTKKNDKVLVFGSEPQIYFYSDRRSSTGYIYTYALLENHSNSLKMQREMIIEIERTKPELIVNFPVMYWDPRWYSNMYIFDWAHYFFKDYQLIGMIDFDDNNNTIYHWGKDALRYYPNKPDICISILKRKENV